MKKLLLLGLIACWNSYAFSQTSGSEIPHRSDNYDLRLLNHYSEQELNDMDESKLESIQYYYTRSFIVEKIDCFDCMEPDLARFDVSLYEKYRKKEIRFSREFDKYGFRLTLLSVNELEHSIPIQAFLH